MAYHIYILECSDGTLYTGVTGNLDNRLREHHFGKFKSCYTFKRRPLKLIYQEEFQWIQDAIAKETQLKKWSAAKKRAYIARDFVLLKELSRSRKNQKSED